MTGTSGSETTTPTYGWATGTGAASSILGLILLAVCIYASATGATEHGFAPVPAGLTALACVLVLGGMVLVLFRILHADRETLDARMDKLVSRLEAMDRKLNNVWGIAAVTSIEAQPAHVRTDTDPKPKHTRRRGRRRNRAAGKEVAADNVIPMRARRAADALRRLTEKLGDQTGE